MLTKHLHFSPADHLYHLGLHGAELADRLGGNGIIGLLQSDTYIALAIVVRSRVRTRH